jgi:hypothetical protein
MVGDERLIATLLACKYACTSGIEGDFVECGVWRGGNSIIAANVFARNDITRKVYLFDTFAGMTKPLDVDVKLKEELDTRAKFMASQKIGHNDWCFAPLEDVKKSFQSLGLLETARFVQGDVMETLDNECNLPEKICVLRLDTDWYESTKKELDVLWCRLQPGGILILDDYGHWQGTKKAVDEFFPLADRPFLHYVDDPSRLIVKR